MYAIGQMSQKGAGLAAVLARGPDAMLSHRDAAALWGVRRTARGAIDITVVGATRRSRPKLTIHSTAALQPADRTTVDRIPVTSIARTLLDLAEVVVPTQLQRACEEAERLRILDVREVAELLARSNGRRGARRLSALLEYDPVAVVDSRSELESRLVDLVREAGIPLPHLNVIVEGYEVDAYWPEARQPGHRFRAAVPHGPRRASSAGHA